MGFEKFWDAYPKKEGRKSAERAYQSAVGRSGVSPSTLAEKAAQYAAAKAHLRDPQYVKTPANWLMDECWLEDPQPLRPKPPKPERSSQQTAPLTKRGRRSKRAQRERELVKEAEARVRAEIRDKEERRLERVASRRRESLQKREAKRPKIGPTEAQIAAAHARHPGMALKFHSDGTITPVPPVAAVPQSPYCGERPEPAPTTEVNVVDIFSAALGVVL